MVNGGAKPWTRSCLFLVSFAVVACAGGPLHDAGIDCDPMAFQSGNNEVWVLANGEQTRLSQEGRTAANPSVFSDGTKILFTTTEQGEDLDLYVIDIDGSNRRLLWGDERLQSEADWSPDGTMVVFDQFTEDGMLQVFSVPADGSREPRQLTEGEPNGKPKWGVDDRILFLSLWDAEEQEIYSMNPDGSDPTNLSNHPARDVLAELSPDGSTIVFASDRSGNGDFDIWLMDVDGSNPRRLTEQVERETNPTWSSDGRHIIYRSDRAPVGLWYMNADGSGQSPLLEEAWLPSCP